MDNTFVVVNLNNRNSEIEEEFDSCTDDKICVYETAISGGYIKREPCDAEDEPKHNNNYVGIKDEIIEDPTVIVPETGFMANIKGNYLDTRCERCGEEYELYCLKCPMLTRIFDRNNPDLSDNMRTLPKNFVDMCETQSGLGIVALRIIPEGVVFGPFQDLDPPKDDIVSKWISSNKELVYTKDPKRINWMQYIRGVDQSSHPNLTPFQHADRLYYRSVCQISVGDELLVYWDSDGNGTTTQDNCLKSQICESFDDVYACTLCCVGYKAIRHLAVHNSRCPGKIDRNDFCKEVIQCDACKIYLDKKEYSDYHMDQCCKSKGEIFALHQEKKQNQGKNADLHLYHTDEKSFVGTHSPYNTMTNGQVKQRIVIHTDDKPFECTQCPYKTKTNLLLKQHLVSHNDDKSFKCTQCPFKTKTNKHLKQHIAIHSDDKTFACSLCSFKTRTSSRLKDHIDIHNEENPLTCSLCSFKTTTSSKLKKHIVIHDEDKPFACSFCSYKSRTNSNLKRHIGIHKGDGPLECNQCPYKTRTNLLLKQHIATQSDDKPFACTRCPYRTKTNLQLKRHIDIHSEDKPFACSLCSFKTRTNLQLKRHIVTHSDDKPFACSLCSHKTKTKSLLKLHMSVHNEKKPFVCSLCSLKMKTQGQLTYHLLSHNDDKPFECIHCPYKTARSWQLKQHIVTHDDDKPFTCSLCSFKTKTNKQLKRHIPTHSDDKPFSCSLCSYKAKRNSDLKKHMAIHR